MSQKDIEQRLARFLRQLAQAKKEEDTQDSKDNDALKTALLMDGLEQFKQTADKILTSNQDVVKAVSDLKIEVPEVKVPDINVPEVKIPEINVPEPKVTVNVPEIKVPKAEVDVKIPEIKVPEPKVTVNVPDVVVPPMEMPEFMNVTGNVGITNTIDEPIPTRIVDREGKDVSFGGTEFSGGGRAGVSYGINPTGGRVPIAVTEQGLLEPASFYLEVSKGNVAGHSIQRIIARNTDVDLAAEDIWFNGGVLSYLSSAEKMNVASSSASDTAAGTGARTVKITGLDGNYNEISETVTMNGLSNVLTTNSYFRVHVCEVITAGSGEKAAGDITLTAQSAGTVQANIPAGENRTGKSQFTIPANKTAYLVDFMPSLAAGKTGSDIVFQARPPGEVFRMISRIAVQSTGTSAINHTLVMSPAQFEEKTDLRVQAIGAANDQDVFCEYTLILVDN